MVRSLLAERFKLRLVEETRQTPMYVLVVAQDGPKISPRTVAPGTVVSTSLLAEKGRLTMTGGSNRDLAKVLSGQLGCQVVDKTGLNGLYDVLLQWTPDHQDSLLAAVHDQLGLKLEDHVSPIATYIIDEVEKPSEN
jgi:uncharacterized protein (TIGR03435 family)